jgi:D-glycero-alpha-D-manno-heptose-7-phosphate kinase
MTSSTGAGAIGAKAMGASGGGCVLILSRPGVRDRVNNAVASLGEILEFDLDADGVSIQMPEVAIDS